MKFQCGLLAFGCSCGLAASASAAGFGSQSPSGGSANYLQGPRRREAAFVSTNIGSVSFKGTRPLFLASPNSGKSVKKRRDVYPQINEYTKRQFSNIFGSGSSERTNFVPLTLAGRWSQRPSENKSSGSVEMILLSSPDQCQFIADAYEELLKSREDPDEESNTIRCLPIPISPSMSTNAIQPLSQTYCDKPLSKSVLLSLNSLFLNRDGGLFDNLPWSTWSVDPNLDERDAANNVVEAKFTMGKRVAYQRFMGKDWQGRSLSLGNLANKVKYLLEGSDEGEEGSICDSLIEGMESRSDEDMMLSLSQRLLELEIKESQMAIAECEQRLAISKIQSIKNDTGSSDEFKAEEQLEKARERLQGAESSLQDLTSAIMQKTTDDEITSFPWKSKDGPKKGDGKQRNFQSLLISILDKLAEQEKPPPYRGAIGYPAKLDTKKEMFEDSVLPYSSPYGLLLDVIDEQLNSEVMGCVLEQSSLLEGNLVLGGALLLKRMGVQKSTTLSGESVSYTDDDDDLGNEGLSPRSMYVVECYSDEAVGMAMASDMPIFVAEDIYNRAGSVPLRLDAKMVSLLKQECGDEDSVVGDVESLSFMKRVPPICPLGDDVFIIQSEGERVSSDKQANLVRIPLTTNPQLFGPDQVPRSSSSPGSSVFSTFNPVKSLQEYDALTDDTKVRLLMKLESFSGDLPRPRAVKASTVKTSDNYDNGTPPSLLDNILLPLVDESIRRQYQIRDAERRRDFNEVDALRSEISPRQVALESAQRAREEGRDDEADRLEEEAELYKALRADITQDEGAYSRFLDRDDWYERETQARIKRLDKKKFGTLLDGIDLP